MATEFWLIKELLLYPTCHPTINVGGFIRVSIEKPLSCKPVQLQGAFNVAL
jgi:hypothetical protein